MLFRSLPLHQIWNRWREAFEVALERRLILAEVPFAFASLLAENVTAAVELMAVQHLARRANLYALGSSSVSTYLRHLFAPSSELRTSADRSAPRKEFFSLLASTAPASPPQAPRPPHATTPPVPPASGGAKEQSATPSVPAAWVGPVVPTAPIVPGGDSGTSPVDPFAIAFP